MPTTRTTRHPEGIRANLFTFIRSASLFFVLTAAILLIAPEAFSQESLYRPTDTRKTLGSEIYLRYFQEHYSYYDEDTRGGAAALVYRGLTKWTFLGELIYQRKFRYNEGFIRLGAAYKFDNGTTVMETIGVPFGSNGTFPDFLTDTEVVHPVTKWASMHLGYKFVTFDDDNVHALYAGTTIYPRKDFYLHVKVFEVITDFSGSAGTDSTTSALFKVGGFPNPVNELALFYGRNAYSFVSAEEIGTLKSNTYGMIWNFDVTETWGIVSAITYEDREEPYSGDQFLVDIGLRFKL